MEQLIVLLVLIAFVALSLSIILNIFMLWYSKNLLTEFLYLTEDISTLKEELDAFKKHISSVYELETFYGDETLHKLLEHAKGTCEVMDGFFNMYEVEILDDEEKEFDEQFEYNNQEEARAQS